jgi:hypothetical protein
VARAPIVKLASETHLFALAQISAALHNDPAFQASSPKNFTGRVFARPFLFLVRRGSDRLAIRETSSKSGG